MSIPKTYDEVCKQIALKIQYNIKALKNGIPISEITEIDLHTIYLFTCLTYYTHNTSYISDVLFDKICKYMLDHHSRFKAKVRHPEKTLCKDDLRAGTGYALEYPVIMYRIFQQYMDL
jgi:hypothetical protein